MELFSCKVSAYFIGHYRTVAVLCLDSGVVFATEKYVLNVNEFCQCMLHLAREDWDLCSHCRGVGKEGEEG